MIERSAASRRSLAAALLPVALATASYLPAVVHGGWILDDDAYVSSAGCGSRRPP
jgi:hypothetical protein